MKKPLKQIYYVFWKWGSCEDGSCCCGMNSYATEKDAMREFEAQKERRGYAGEVCLIHGTTVCESDN